VLVSTRRWLLRILRRISFEPLALALLLRIRRRAGVTRCCDGQTGDAQIHLPPWALLDMDLACTLSRRIASRS
jgi:hypothetical protein